MGPLRSLGSMLASAYEMASSMLIALPMRELVCGLSPAVSERTKRAAESLKYRDFLTVMLILKDRQMFDDN